MKVALVLISCFLFGLSNATGPKPKHPELYKAHYIQMPSVKGAATAVELDDFALNRLFDQAIWELSLKDEKIRKNNRKILDQEYNEWLESQKQNGEGTKKVKRGVVVDKYVVENEGIKKAKEDLGRIKRRARYGEKPVLVRVHLEKVPIEI
uniref:Uncharacterized protein n=1 Tax=Panagrolaimus sp. JU765 TaxID=591449 RepID=A0AC34RP34_9BILA